MPKGLHDSMFLVTAQHCLFIREASEADQFTRLFIDIPWRLIYSPLIHSSMKVEMRVLMQRSQRTVHFAFPSTLCITFVH